MDFYNLQESDHRLIEKTMMPLPDSQGYKDYLLRHFLDFEGFLNKERILLVEEDPRIQRAMRNLILEVNEGAVCWTVDSLEGITDILDEKRCDLLIANYYLSEDEIDLEYWDYVRSRYPRMEVMILSHVNEREYYQILEKMASQVEDQVQLSLPSRIKIFFQNVFGG
jgi:hypothetical protein